MRWAHRLTAATLLTAGLPVAAEACTLSPGLALIHSALPAPLPQGLFIAEVEIDRSTVREFADARVRARVTKVIQGDADVSRLLLRAGFITNCDEPLANGSTGLLLGVPRGYEGGVLVVEPITARRINAYRLPDGFSVPLECRGPRCAATRPVRPRRRR